MALNSIIGKHNCNKIKLDDDICEKLGIEGKVDNRSYAQVPHYNPVPVKHSNPYG